MTNKYKKYSLVPFECHIDLDLGHVGTWHLALIRSQPTFFSIFSWYDHWPFEIMQPTHYTLMRDLFHMMRIVRHLYSLQLICDTSFHPGRSPVFDTINENKWTLTRTFSFSSMSCAGFICPLHLHSGKSQNNYFTALYSIYQDFYGFQPAMWRASELSRVYPTFTWERLPWPHPLLTPLPHSHYNPVKKYEVNTLNPMIWSTVNWFYRKKHFLFFKENLQIALLYKHVIRM